MKKLYSEKQYREYSNLMDKMANTDDILEGFNIHIEIDDWIKDNNLIEMAVTQMDKRLEEEFIKENSNKPNKDFKVIEFPKNMD